MFEVMSSNWRDGKNCRMFLRQNSLDFQFIFWLRRKFSISKIIAFTNEKSSFFLEKIKTRYFSKNVAKKWSKKEEKKTPKNAFWKILYTLCRAYVGYTEGIQRVYRWDAEKPFLKYMGFIGILATFRIIIFAIFFDFLAH